MNEKINRRALLLGAVVLVGGAGALARFSQRSSDATPGNRTAMGAEQFALLEQISEVMIPTTDTPGAIGAGVPAFIRQMFDEWASVETRAQLAGVLEGIEKVAWAKFGASFVELPPERRHEVVRGVDQERIGRQDPAYAKFKNLVLTGYYLSEVGATRELRYELIPGAWRACVPLTEIGRASAVG